MPPDKHILCLYLPNWTITRRFRKHPEARDRPIVVVRSVGQRRLICAACSRAVAQGIQPGLNLAEARALCPGLCSIDEESLEDDRALEALGRWLVRFTPIVARGAHHVDPAHACLFLDLTGSERLFGGMRLLVDRIHRSLIGLCIPAQLSIAPTPGAAWAFAIANQENPRMVDASSLVAKLSPLPIAALRLDAQVLENLSQLGLHRIGDLLALPREQLPSRFGPMLLRRIDQLTGLLAEPLVNLVYDPPVTARLEFEAPIDALEDIWRIFEKLLDDVLSDLARRLRGVRQLQLILKPDRGWGLATVKRVITLSRPHRERAALVHLLRGEIEKIDLEHGFTEFRLSVPNHEPLAEAQRQLFDQQTVDQQRQWDRLLERLRARLGEKSVILPKLLESYLPERAWRPAGEDQPSATMLASAPVRPLTLFPTPIEIRVISEPFDRRTGQPRQFTWEGRVHRLTHAVGPERIAGEWWRGHRHTRDYFDTEDETGQRFWIFRVMHADDDGHEHPRWFLHGRFD